jgi:hypothetical protein
MAEFHIAYLIYVPWNLRVFRTADWAFHHEVSSIKTRSAPPATIAIAKLSSNIEY